MSILYHERPGVYSDYEVSRVTASGSAVKVLAVIGVSPAKSGLYTVTAVSVIHTGNKEPAVELRNRVVTAASFPYTLTVRHGIRERHTRIGGGRVNDQLAAVRRKRRKIRIVGPHSRGYHIAESLCVAVKIEIVCAERCTEDPEERVKERRFLALRIKNAAAVDFRTDRHSVVDLPSGDRIARTFIDSTERCDLFRCEIRFSCGQVGKKGIDGVISDAGVRDKGVARLPITVFGEKCLCRRSDARDFLFVKHSAAVGRGQMYMRPETVYMQKSAVVRRNAGDDAVVIVREALYHFHRLIAAGRCADEI